MQALRLKSSQTALLYAFWYSWQKSWHMNLDKTVNCPLPVRPHLQRLFHLVCNLLLSFWRWVSSRSPKSWLPENIKCPAVFWQVSVHSRALYAAVLYAGYSSFPLEQSWCLSSFPRSAELLLCFQIWIVFQSLYWWCEQMETVMPLTL